jgi:transposase-like protein
VLQAKIKARPKAGTKRRWTREFKLSAIARMNEAVGVKALADELGDRAELLYD